MGCFFVLALFLLFKEECIKWEVVQKYINYLHTALYVQALYLCGHCPQLLLAWLLLCWSLDVWTSSLVSLHVPTDQRHSSLCPSHTSRMHCLIQKLQCPTLLRKRGFSGGVGRVPVRNGLHLLLFSRSIVSDSLRPHELQPARLPCPSPAP